VPADLPLLRIGLGQSGAVSALRIRLPATAR
jgi:type VI secretion system protein ImpG